MSFDTDTNTTPYTPLTEVKRRHFASLLALPGVAGAAYDETAHVIIVFLENDSAAVARTIPPELDGSVLTNLQKLPKKFYVVFLLQHG